MRSSTSITRRERRGLPRPLAVTAAAIVAAVSLMGATAASASPGQVVTTGIDPNIAAQTLAGAGITPTNVSYTGSPLALGTFSGMGAIGFDSGIILSSGDAAGVVGPNLEDSKTTSFGLPGDAQLDGLVAPNTTNDAAVLQFDFVPATNTVSFKYVFSSDEYNEFVNGSFDDVFGFFVNGTNCAVVGGQRVSINTINGGNPFGTSANNPTLYRNNAIADGSTIDTEMDGLTTVLNCTATVNPGVTNTLRLAIADTSDDALDTAVFLQADSFQSNMPPTCTGSSVGVPMDTAVAFTVSASDPNTTDVLTYAIASPPANGTLTGTAPDLVYTPNTGFSGTDTFTFTASDGTATCAPATVELVAGLTPPGIALSTVTAQPGDIVTVTGGGFAPNSEVVITIESTPQVLGIVNADPTGAVSASVGIPTSIAEGVHTIKLTGQAVGGAVVVQSHSITIASAVAPVAPAAAPVQAAPLIAAATPRQALPATGAGTTLLFVLGLALVAGGAAVLRWQRRTTSDT